MDAIEDELNQLFTIYWVFTLWKKITMFALFYLVDLKRFVDRSNLPCSYIITTYSEKLFV